MKIIVLAMLVCFAGCRAGYYHDPQGRTMWAVGVLTEPKFTADVVAPDKTRVHVQYGSVVNEKAVASTASILGRVILAAMTGGAL